MLTAGNSAFESAGFEPLSDARALELADSGPELLPEIRRAACRIRDRQFGRTITFSPKVFLPVTNLCRNRCDYCSFRRSPGDEGATRWAFLGSTLSRQWRVR